jgi:formylglycine-generating enzyme required for sulfatase activity
MTGNVWEWCQSKLLDNYKGYDRNAKDREKLDGESARVVRGGAWYRSPRDCRAAYRFGNNPLDRYDGFGFRVVCAVLCAR